MTTGKKYKSVEDIAKELGIDLSITDSSNNSENNCKGDSMTKSKSFASLRKKVSGKGVKEIQDTIESLKKSSNSSSASMSSSSNSKVVDVVEKSLSAQRRITKKQKQKDAQLELNRKMAEIDLLDKTFTQASVFEIPEITKEYILKCQNELNNIGARLKQKFIGIDDVIDMLLKKMQIWYIMPHVMTRPTIINLWGMTGVGKTDLIRTLVSEISFDDRFIEFQLSNKGVSNLAFHSTIKAVLDSSAVEIDRPCIVLFDEIQRFHTVNEEGHEIDDCKFQDLWMLLSDGKFSGSSSDKDDLIEMMFNDIYWEQQRTEQSMANEDNDEDEESDENENKNRKYHMSHYEAVRLKKLLKLNISVLDVMKWPRQVKRQKIMEAINSPRASAAVSYPQMLIFIAGNLDEAYSMSSDTEDADIDADVLHSFSKSINVTTIKASLKRRFKPEQIARFGNIHIIYPSLSKHAYRTIIRNRICQTLSNVEKVSNIKINFDETMIDFVYRNGVYPAQGVRPVFSTISSYVDSVLPDFIFHAKYKNFGSIQLVYSESEVKGIFEDGSFISVHIEGELDKIKSVNNIDMRFCTSVHEAGHAIVYAKLFNLSPTQIVSNSVSAIANGFIGSHSNGGSKIQIENTIALYMAGRASEEVVFGDSMVTSGSRSDIEQATIYASKYVRELCMSPGISSSMGNQYTSNHLGKNFEINETNKLIDKMVEKGLCDAKSILLDKKAFLCQLSKDLAERGNVSSEDFKSMAHRYGIEIEILDPKFINCHDYKRRFEEFLKNSEGKEK